MVNLKVAFVNLGGFQVIFFIWIYGSLKSEYLGDLNER